MGTCVCEGVVCLLLLSDLFCFVLAFLFFFLDYLELHMFRELPSLVCSSFVCPHVRLFS